MTKAVRWTQDELDAFQKRKAPATPINTVAAQQIKPKANKHRNKKVTIDGVTHDSGKEARRWVELQQMETAFVIVNLKRQVAFELAPAVRLAGEKRKKPALRYVADFVYVIGGVTVIEDVKSKHTRTLRPYRDRKHLMKTVLGLDVTEI